MLEIVKNIQGKQLEFTHFFGFFSDEAKPFVSCNCQAKLEKYFTHKNVKREFGEITPLLLTEEEIPSHIILVCLGKKEEYSFEKFKEILITLSTKLEEKSMINVDSFARNLDVKEVLKKMVLSFQFYNYQYNECKSEKKPLDRSVFFAVDEDMNDLIEEYYVLGSAINNARDLVNKPYNYLSALDLANYAESLANSQPQIAVKVFQKPELEAMKMGAFLGVNKGSFDEPKLIYLTYQGNSDSSDYIGLIGKGVMYDTGGYSIKSSMNNMKDDMGGAATVLGVFEAIAKNGLKVNVKGVIAATDNRIDGKATLPDDVLTSMNGKTIEVVSTDAEGRLTLADALTFIQKEGCKTLIDLATLTGSVVAALGEYITGIFGNDQALVDSVIQSGKVEDEDLWQLPITGYVRKMVRSSKVADLTNSAGRLMGASSAAAFLEEFIEKGNRWVHLDIAGTAFHTSPSYQEFYGASGVMVKTLYQLLKNNI
ncbi:MAG: leucyl aminopeptidase [Bacilli bacterium]|nr:leucyl aminopeptidase [Bacilli bacterium]